MKTETTVLPAEIQEIAKGVSVEKRNEVQSVLNKVFNGVSKMREQLDSIVVEDENDKVNMKLSNTIRLGVRQTRLEAEKTFDSKRSEVQQAMLSFKTEDSLWLKAKQTMQILTREIEENARWKEETAKRFEAEQKELKTKQRENLVNKFNPEITRNEFENMGDETFNTFLSGIKKAYNDKIEAEKAEAKRIEDERIAKEKAIEAQRLENERLKKEAEAREKEREQAEAEANKLKAELKAKQDAEKKAEDERVAKQIKEEKERQKLAKAPIKDKLNLWVDSFQLTNTEVKNDTTKKIKDKFDVFKTWSKSQIEVL